MICKLTDLHDKEVINVCDGTRLGCVDDVEIDTCTAQLVSIVIFGHSKVFGLLGHEEDLIICWKDIEVIGDDTILVKLPPLPSCPIRRKRDSILHGIFGGR